MRTLMRLLNRRQYFLLFGIVIISTTACNPEKPQQKIPVTSSNDLAITYFKKGRDAQDRLLIDDAEVLFKQAVKEDSNFALAHLYLARVQTNEAAMKSLERAKSLADYVSEGENKLILAAWEGSNNNLTKIREIVEELSLQYPQDERIFQLLGNYHFGQQRYTLAIQSYKQAISLNPDFSAPYNQLGYAYQYLGDYVQSEKMFKKYIELIPNDPNPYDSYAELLLKMGKFEESINYFQKAININPDFFESYNGIATCMILMDRFEEARNQIRMMETRFENPANNRMALNAYIISYIFERKFDKAIEYQLKIIKMDENNNDDITRFFDILNLGMIYIYISDYSSAERVFEDATQVYDLISADTFIKNNIENQILFMQSLFDVYAKKDYTSALKKAKKFQMFFEKRNDNNRIQQAHQLFGIIYYEMEDYKRAMDELNLGGSNNAHVLYRKALIYQKTGNREKALKYGQAAYNFNRKNDRRYAFFREDARKLIESLSN